jgi:hypothetical protein
MQNGPDAVEHLDAQHDEAGVVTTGETDVIEIVEAEAEENRQK